MEVNVKVNVVMNVNVNVNVCVNANMDINILERNFCARYWIVSPISY
jgi:hypothetical protein